MSTLKFKDRACVLRYGWSNSATPHPSRCTHHTPHIAHITPLTFHTPHIAAPLHWIYDQGKVQDLTKGHTTEFYPTSQCPFYTIETGRTSTYGDQLHVTLKSLAERKGILMSGMNWRLLRYPNWKLRRLHFLPYWYDQEFITIRVCNLHMVSTPAIWVGCRRQSAVNMFIRYLTWSHSRC